MCLTKVDVMYIFQKLETCLKETLQKCCVEIRFTESVSTDMMWFSTKWGCINRRNMYIFGGGGGVAEGGVLLVSGSHMPKFHQMC